MSVLRSSVLTCAADAINMRGKTRKLTIASMLTALGIITLYIAYIFPAQRFALPAVASLFVVSAVIECGISTGAAVYVSCTLLSLLLLPDKLPALLFAAFFGLYPVIKSLVERLRKPVIEYILKLAFFNASFTVIWLFMTELFTGTRIEGMATAVVYVIFNVVFVVFDIGLSRLIGLYINKISKKLNK